MNREHFAYRYTGARAAPFAPPVIFPRYAQETRGFCRSCGHPNAQCQCGYRECRKEAKELLVTAASTGNTRLADTRLPFGIALPASGIDSAFIGGGCCVHISVEYAPVTPTVGSSVTILVLDAEGTALAWQKSEDAGARYQVKESVITTKPGATVIVAVTNMTARIRWCEIFSC